MSVTDLKQDAIQLFKEKAVKRGRLTKEEVSVEDLEILVTFLGMISADLALLLIKKGRLAASQAAQSTSIDTTTEETSEDVESTLVRKSRHRKKKKIKKKKVKIKQVYNKK